MVYPFFVTKLNLPVKHLDSNGRGYLDMRFSCTHSERICTTVEDSMRKHITVIGWTCYATHQLNLSQIYECVVTFDVSLVCVFEIHCSRHISVCIFLIIPYCIVFIIVLLFIRALFPMFSIRLVFTIILLYSLPYTFSKLFIFVVIISKSLFLISRNSSFVL